MYEHQQRVFHDFFFQSERSEKEIKGVLRKKKNRKTSILVIDPTVSLKIDHILRSKQIHRQNKKKTKPKKPKEQFLSVQLPLANQILFHE